MTSDDWSELARRQRLFARLLPRLIDRAYYLGYEVGLGESWRPPEMVAIYVQQGKGSGTSVHPLRLAQDFNLHRGNVYLTKTEDHAELGAYWKKLDPLCRWGGDFTRPDGNHYSLAWGRYA